MSSDLVGATASARLHDLGYALPRQGPINPEYLECQGVDTSIHMAGRLPYLGGRLPAIGVAGLPRNSPVEIRMICTDVADTAREDSVREAHS